MAKQIALRTLETDTSLVVSLLTEEAKQLNRLINNAVAEDKAGSAYSKIEQVPSWRTRLARVEAELARHR